MTDSPFLSKLDTNYIPEEEDVPKIREIISQQTEKLSVLALEVSNAKQRYDELLAKQVELDKFIEAHRHLISPPRRNTVPADIWREIFYHCLPENHDAIMDHHEAPLLLTLVCSTWRDIALATPRLWSSAHIPVVETVPTISADQPLQLDKEIADLQTRAHRRAKRVLEWLSRASSSPLVITLGDTSFVPYPDMPLQTTQSHILLQSILPFSKQWHRLRIGVTKVRIDDLSHLTPSDLCSLESLEVDKMISWEDPDNPLAPSPHSSRNLSLFHAPNLRRVTLGQMPEDICAFHLPWHQLTHLSLSYNNYPKSAPEIINLLKACPMLVKFRIVTVVQPHPRGDQPSTLPPNNRGQITLPDLKVLEISDEVVCGNPKMFDALHMPALQRVSWFIPCTPGTPLLTLARQYNLTSLNTNPAIFCGDDFLECLRSCPNLRELFLSSTFNYNPDAPSHPGFDRSDRFLEILSIPDDNGDVLCPLLEVFELTMGSAEYSDRAIVNFVKAKHAGVRFGVAKLKCLKISFSRSQQDPMLDDLKPYTDDGLDLVLSYLEKFPDLHKSDAYRNLPFQGSDVLNHYELTTIAKVF